MASGWLLKAISNLAALSVFDLTAPLIVRFALTRQEFLSSEDADETHIVKTLQTFPNEPPEYDVFINRALQSTNQTSQTLYKRLYNDFFYASTLSSTYLTRSPFLASLLGIPIFSDEGTSKHDFTTDILDWYFDLIFQSLVVFRLIVLLRFGKRIRSFSRLSYRT